MNQKPKIVAVFIAYKASGTLEDFYRSFPKELFDEIILIDDASKDGTYELARKLGIESYSNPVNLGYGGNMKRALTLALGKGADIIVDIHPDGEYLPSAIKPALGRIGSGSEFVLGNRFFDKHTPKKSGMYSWKVLPLTLLSWLSKLVLRLPITDYHQGFRVYTQPMLQKINFLTNSNDYSFSIELIAQAAFFHIKVSEVPVEVSYTGDKRGASLKNSVIYSLKTLVILLKFIGAKIGLSSTLFSKPA